MAFFQKVLLENIYTSRTNTPLSNFPFVLVNDEQADDVSPVDGLI